MCFCQGYDSDGGCCTLAQGLAVRCQHYHRTHARMELIVVGHSSRQCGERGGASAWATEKLNGCHQGRESLAAGSEKGGWLLAPTDAKPLSSFCCSPSLCFRLVGSGSRF